MRTSISLLLVLGLSSTALAGRTITTTITDEVSTTTIYHTIGGSSTSIETSLVKSTHTSLEVSPTSSSAPASTSSSSSSPSAVIHPTSSKVSLSTAVTAASSGTVSVVPSSSAPFPTNVPAPSETGTLATGAPVSPPTSFPGPTSGAEGRMVNYALGVAAAFGAAVWGLC